MTTEEIAGKLTYFQEQIHMIHWQTRSFAEHKATGGFYEFLQEFRDDIIEKMMGYTGKRIKSLKIDAISSDADAMKIADEVMMFANDLEEYGDMTEYMDICNMAEDLSGRAAKLKYLLTLS